MRRVVIVAALLLPACAAFSDVAGTLVQAAQAAQTLGTLLDTAEYGVDRYLARHPNESLAVEIDRVLRHARAALVTYDRLVATSGATLTQIDAARAAALDAYARLRDVLAAAGVLDAQAPMGGAESDAPAPSPFDLPTRDTLEALWAPTHS